MRRLRRLSSLMALARVSVAPQGKDIADGNKKLVLGLLWQVTRCRRTLAQPQPQREMDLRRA